MKKIALICLMLITSVAFCEDIFLECIPANGECEKLDSSFLTTTPGWERILDVVNIKCTDHNSECYCPVDRPKCCGCRLSRQTLNPANDGTYRRDDFSNHSNYFIYDECMQFVNNTVNSTRNSIGPLCFDNGKRF